MKPISSQTKSALIVLGAALVALAAILLPTFLPQLGVHIERKDFRIGERLPDNTATTATGFRQIAWDDLVPKHWDPLKDFKGLDLQNLTDADPKAIKALENLRDVWERAPVKTDLNGQRIRLPGFVIPLERQDGMMTEFLLVPYFGACIHTPPPPSNQIIHAIAGKPVKEFRSMEAAWVSGELEARRSTTGFGTAGYRLKALEIEAYQFPPREGTPRAP